MSYKLLSPLLGFLLILVSECLADDGTVGTKDGAASVSKDLSKWAEGRIIDGKSTVLEMIRKNQVPKQVLSTPVEIQVLRSKFSLSASQTVLKGGLNGAGYDVFRLSGRRLLVCLSQISFDRANDYRSIRSVLNVSVIRDVPIDELRRAFVTFPEVERVRRGNGQ